MNEDFPEQRKNLIENMKQSGALKSKSVGNAFLNVKRELFFPNEMKAHSYADTAFPIGLGQAISQPSTIAIMLEMLDVKEGMKVLEVGAGSGYVVALLSELVGSTGKAYGVELVSELKERAAKNLIEARAKNFELAAKDGTLAWKEKAPFDRILLSAAGREIPEPLAGQLKEGGKLVAPIGGSATQELVCMQKQKGRLNEIERKCCFAFVPLKGKFGFE